MSSSKDRMTISIDYDLKESAKNKFSNVSEVISDNLRLLIEIDEMDEIEIIRKIEDMESERKSIESQIKTLNKELADFKESKADEKKKKKIEFLTNVLKIEYNRNYGMNQDKLNELVKLEGKTEEEIIEKIKS